MYIYIAPVVQASSDMVLRNMAFTSHAIHACKVNTRFRNPFCHVVNIVYLGEPGMRTLLTLPLLRLLESIFPV